MNEALDLFTHELLDVIRSLQQSPELGHWYEAVRFETPVRRILLRTTETHVYHALVEGTVVIVAVWGARRGRGPRL